MEKKDINKNQTQTQTGEKMLTLSQVRHELGIPLILAKKMVIWGEMKAVRAMDGTLRVAGSEVKKTREILKNPRKKLSLFFKALGPGVITGASDDDPSGIGTYSSVGARFGLSVIWMAAWLLPIMIAVQEVCARIGIVTNRGLAGVLQKYYKKKYVVFAVLLLIIANVINIGADLGAMAASLEMIIRLNFYLSVLIFAFISIIFEVFIGYHIYVKILKWLTVSVFAYIFTGIIIRPDWTAVFRNLIIPYFSFDKEYLFAVVAVFGTTITPYLFFWQASEEVEENKLSGKIICPDKKKFVRGRIARMRTDVGAGMLLANVVFFFIVLTTAQALFRNGINEINSAQEAAMALRPLAGHFAYVLFAFGIIGTGLLAVPVLAGSGAYAISEIMKWKEGLDLKFRQAKGFYLVIAVSILVGMVINFFHVNPIAALYYSAFINGIIALPLLAAIMLIGDNPKIMGEERHPKWVKFFGWLSIIFVASATIVLLVHF